MSKNQFAAKANNKGKAQNTIGTIQQGYGDVKKDLKNGS